MGSLIDDDDSDSVSWRWASNASGWNAYRGIIVDRQSGNRGIFSEIMSGPLDNNKPILKDAMGETEPSQ